MLRTYPDELENEIIDIFEQWFKYYNRTHKTNLLPESIIDEKTLKHWDIKKLLFISFREGYLLRKEDLENIKKTESLWKKLFVFGKKSTY